MWNALVAFDPPRDLLPGATMQALMARAALSAGGGDQLQTAMDGAQGMTIEHASAMWQERQVLPCELKDGAGTSKRGILAAGIFLSECCSVMSASRERILAAILVADAVGYSWLMGSDEEGTHLKYISDMDAVIEPAVAKHKGRLIKQTGDGVIVLFASVVEAVGCACDIQGLGPKGVAASKSPTKLTYRIGINLGDIILDNNDVYGNDVNIAVRLESLSQPGRFTLSGPAYWNVKNKVDLGFEELGFLRLKNITDPIQVFSTIITSENHDKFTTNVPEVDHDYSKGQFFTDKANYLPQVIVLPFQNLSSDPKQEYFCDGLTNDLTTDLSRFSNLSVISANTAFTYKDIHPHHSKILRELGAGYMIEGSVQRRGNMVGINAQLIETRGGRHVWADRFTVPLEELFDVQDDLCHKIVASLAAKVGEVEINMARRKVSDDVNAYETFLKGMHAINLFLSSAETRETLDEVSQLFRRAIDMDPEYARAYGWLSYALILQWQHNWADDGALDEAEALARRAVSLDPNDHDTHWALACVLSNAGLYDRALAEYERALSLNPNDSNLHAEMAELVSRRGKHAEAIGQVKYAMRMNPSFPDWYRWTLAWCYYFIGEYPAAITELERMLKISDEGMLILAASYAQHGRNLAENNPEASNSLMRKAHQTIAEFKARRKDWDVQRQQKIVNMQNKKDFDHWLEGLRLAGLGEDLQTAGSGSALHNVV